MFHFIRSLMASRTERNSHYICFRSAPLCVWHSSAHRGRKLPAAKVVFATLIFKSMSTPRAGSAGTTPCLQYHLFIMFHSKKAFSA